MKKRKARWGCVSLLEPLRSERCPGVKENSWTLNCFRDFVLSSLFFLFLSGQRWKCWYLHQNVASKSIRISSKFYQTFICYFILLFRVILIIRFLIKISFVEMYEGIGRSTPSYEWTVSRRAISAKRFAHATIGRHYRLESLRDFAQIKWRLWRGRSAFSLMPFRAFAMLKRRQSSESLQPSLGRGYRGDRRRKGAFRAKLCDASTPRTFGPHKGLSLSLALLADRFTASPFAVFLSTYTHSDTVLDVLRRIFHRIAGSQDFLSPSSGRRRKDPSRCSWKPISSV